MAALAQVSSKRLAFRHVLNTVRLAQLRLFQINQRCIHVGEHFTRGSLPDIELCNPVPLAGRKYLPSSQTIGFPKYLSGPRENYPLLVNATNGQGTTTLTHWAKRCREIIDQAYSKYDQDGSPVAILFRGLPITHEKDLSLWTNNLGYKQFAYVGGGGPRNEIAENVAEGALDADVFSIEPHSEMAYSIRYPKIFIVGNFKTASWGGETAICDVREVHAKLDPSFIEQCEKRKVRYWHFLPDKTSKQNAARVYQSWQLHFMTEDRSKLEGYLKEHVKGYSWHEDGSLFYWDDFPPFIKHPRSACGERLWFNQVAGSHCSYHACSPLFEHIKLPNKMYPYHTTFGDGVEFEQSVIDDIRRIIWESAVGFQWNDGDVLFLDQLVVQHSRLGFEGRRKVGISLLDY